MTWRQLAATVEESQAESLSDWFMGQGALSVGFDDAGDQPLFEPPPGETPLWQITKVTALFEGDVDGEAIALVARRQFGERILDWDSVVIEDQVWERAWMEHFKPMQFGQRLWICPTGYEPPDPTAVNVILDPGFTMNADSGEVIEHNR